VASGEETVGAAYGLRLIVSTKARDRSTLGVPSIPLPLLCKSKGGRLPTFPGSPRDPRHGLVSLRVGLAGAGSLAHLLHSRHILARYRRLFDGIKFLLFHAHSLR